MSARRPSSPPARAWQLRQRRTVRTAGCALRLMGWLDSMGKLPTPPSLLVFALPKIVEVIEAFVKKHCLQL